MSAAVGRDRRCQIPVQIGVPRAGNVRGYIGLQARAGLGQVEPAIEHYGFGP